jgi:hypothetical protein
MRTVIALAMILTASAANAQKYKGWGIGYGAATCRQFAQDYRLSVDEEKIYFSWAQGFMTATNLGNTNGTYRDLSAWSVDDQSAFIRSYCNSHPLSNYGEAVFALLFSLPVIHVPK